MYQNSLGMLPSVLNTDPILFYGILCTKRNWCTKRKDCANRTENNQKTILVYQNT